MDAWVVEALRVGYRIPFDRRPPLSKRPLSLPAFSPQSIRGVALTQELQNLLRKGAVDPALQPPGFYSRLFLVQKTSGSWHPITDLSTLNDYITFRVLCFGLSAAPRVFTRIMVPVSAILPRYGVRFLRYLGVWLILASPEIACIQSRVRLLSNWKVLLWAENRRVRLLPQFIMRSSNVTSDALCRPIQVIGSELALHQEVIDQLVHQ